MTGYRQTLLVLLLTILSGAAVAQNNTNSPYTRYGYGQLSEQGSSYHQQVRLHRQRADHEQDQPGTGRVFHGQERPHAS